jgi:hypothetical protein
MPPVGRQDGIAEFTGRCADQEIRKRNARPQSSGSPLAATTIMGTVQLHVLGDTDYLPPGSIVQHLGTSCRAFKPANAGGINAQVMSPASRAWLLSHRPSLLRRAHEVRHDQRLAGRRTRESGDGFQRARPSAHLNREGNVDGVAVAALADLEVQGFGQ